MVTRYTYLPFGLTTISQRTDTGNPYQYTGRENDGPTLLYHYRARYYSPLLRRFISQDPIGFAGGDVNFYAYTGNSPVNFTDALGLYWEYSQSSGALVYVDEETGERIYIGKGYSGHGRGYNNPTMQNQLNVGPIPRGTWRIGPAFDHPHKGDITMSLKPVEVDMSGRSGGFLIHGDNSCQCGTASTGCIVLDEDYRRSIAGSGDDELRVVR